MKNMKLESPLIEISADKKLTNHSARKTAVKKMKKAGIPKSEIIAITGHANERGLDDYDSGDDIQQEIYSNAIDRVQPSSQLRPVSATSSINCSSYSRQVIDQPKVQSSPKPVNFNFSNCNATVNMAPTHPSEVIPGKQARLTISKENIGTHNLSQSSPLVPSAFNFELFNGL